MKRKFLKGFTLVELIIVMALMTILMAAIMQLFKPIRETFVDSTTYEEQRTVQTGMVKYITESIRFSTDLGIYSKTGAINSAGKAVDEFASAYVAANPSASEDDVKKNAQVIIIDRENNYGPASDPNTYKGRILRRKISGNTLNTVADPKRENLTTSNVYLNWRLAMGESYYGLTNDYTITLSGAVDTGNMSDGIKVTVACQKPKLTGTASTTISNTGTVICQNLVSGTIGNNSSAGIQTPGLFDVSNYNTNPTSIYIVFLTEKI